MDGVGETWDTAVVKGAQRAQMMDGDVGIDLRSWWGQESRWCKVM